MNIFWGDYQLFDTNILCFDASTFSNLMVRIGSWRNILDEAGTVKTLSYLCETSLRFQRETFLCKGGMVVIRFYIHQVCESLRGFLRVYSKTIEQRNFSASKIWVEGIEVQISNIAITTTVFWKLLMLLVATFALSLVPCPCPH